MKVFGIPTGIGERMLVGMFALALVVLSSDVSSQVTDTTPPTLIGIEVTPPSVDVSSAAAEIMLAVHLTDDSSGVASWSITFSSPSGLHSLTIGADPGLVSGTLNDGSFQATGTLPHG